MKEYKIEVPDGCKPVNVQVDGRFITYGVEEEAFEPKDGDVCCVDNRPFVCRGHNNDGEILGYFGIGTLNTIAISQMTSESWSAGKNYRYATEEEKQQLFDALAKEGKHWNADTKQIEDVRWRANKGRPYYTLIDVFDIYQSVDSRCPVDDKRYNDGLYFKTKEEAEAMAEEFKKLLKQ